MSLHPLYHYRKRYSLPVHHHLLVTAHLWSELDLSLCTEDVKCLVDAWSWSLRVANPGSCLSPSTIYPCTAQLLEGHLRTEAEMHNARHVHSTQNSTIPTQYFIYKYIATMTEPILRDYSQISQSMNMYFENMHRMFKYICTSTVSVLRGQVKPGTACIPWDVR